jgi:molybdopterin molybdotransferase
MSVPLLEIEEALARVLKHAAPLAPMTSAASDALGLVLAESVTSDIDSPPHDKSIVDGFAVRSADLTTAGVELTIVEEIMAGQVPVHTVQAGTTSRIMTGAPIPPGADAVVMVERTRLIAPDRVRMEQASVKPGQNIMPRASSLAAGQAVLSPGTVLRAIEIGLLHEVGHTNVQAHPRPSVAVLATGDELVAASDRPRASQIRNSNGPMIAGLVSQAGGEPRDLGIGRDDARHLQSLCEQGLGNDVLVISGGVSAGVLDLVPQVLRSLGVQQVFHKVNLKPGKPLWFGVRESGSRKALVFGLPGNPVSSLVCFELFVRPALARLAGRAAEGLVRTSARLATDFEHRGDRVTLFPASVAGPPHALTVTPLDWGGSGDLRTLTEAQALIHFPAGTHRYTSGESVPVLLLAGATST